ncbi:MAG: hypothetical protein [Sanya fiers-like virus 34]|nr:MAG: hypothetical protein [Sanya fiers-like virus 34]
MPQVSAITINDGQATPVATTFTPMGKDAKDIIWYEQTTPAVANSIGRCKIGIRVERNLAAQGDLTSAYARVTITVLVPTAEAMSVSDGGFVPAPRLAYRELARLAMELAERSTTQERKNLRVFLQNLLGHAVATSVIDSLETIYGA